MYRDKDGKSTDQRFCIEEMGSDTLGIIDRSTSFTIAGAWTDDVQLARRIVNLLNEYGVEPGEFMAK